MNPFDENNNIQTCIPDLRLNKNPIPPIGGGLPKQKEQNTLQNKIDTIFKNDLENQKFQGNIQNDKLNNF